MTDASKRGRSRGQSEGRDRDATPEYPIEGTVLLSEGFKKAKRTPQEIVGTHLGKQEATLSSEDEAHPSNPPWAQAINILCLK